MIYALDTNVLSALRRRRPEDEPAVEWARGVDSGLVYVPSVVLAELRYGIERVARRGDADQAARLRAWLDGLVRAYEGRVLDLTADAALVAGEMLADPQAPAMADCLIAATARVHGATLVTRNGRDFARTGVDFIDPWAAHLD
ncbi:type II toxin-antitoxin system VapC family toxin [Demequina pelophila]|uniref:type II toxin-antitoxin system VapC family toxin n=1 Tax=Demequina pelophila TaxID=1638984 RepID=UPI0007829192|nr:type II toxin-antitoxin system VapC family toxin [Demequina pelophila]